MVATRCLTTFVSMYCTYNIHGVRYWCHTGLCRSLPTLVGRVYVRVYERVYLHEPMGQDAHALQLYMYICTIVHMYAATRTHGQRPPTTAVQCLRKIAIDRKDASAEREGELGRPKNTPRLLIVYGTMASGSIQ